MAGKLRIAKRKVIRRRYGRKPRVARSMAGTRADRAVVKQTLSGIAGNTSYNSIYKAYNISLASADRAIQVANAYQEFRIKYVEMRFKPSVNMYQGLPTNNGSLPYLHFLIDKTGTMNQGGLNFNILRDAGVKAFNFTREKIVRFKPACVLSTTDAQGIVNTNKFQKPMVSPWLATNANGANSGQTGFSPNSTDHFGIVWGVQQETQIGSSPPYIMSYDVDITIVYEFRKPRGLASSGVTLPTIEWNWDTGEGSRQEP